MKRNNLFAIVFLLIGFIVLTSCARPENKPQNQKSYLETYLLYPESTVVYSASTKTKESLILKSNSDPKVIESYYQVILPQEGFTLNVEKPLSDGYFLEFQGKAGKIELSIIKEKTKTSISIYFEKNGFQK